MSNLTENPIPKPNSSFSLSASSGLFTLLILTALLLGMRVQLQETRSQTNVSFSTGLLALSKKFNNDTGITVGVRARSAVKPEGNTGATPYTSYTFMVHRPFFNPFGSHRTGFNHAVTVSYAVTGSGTDPADANDFAGCVLPSGMVVLNNILDSQQVTVFVNGDLQVEPDENFTLRITNLSSICDTYILPNDTSAIGTIQNDDACDESLDTRDTLLCAAFTDVNLYDLIDTVGWTITFHTTYCGAGSETDLLGASTLSMVQNDTLVYVRAESSTCEILDSIKIFVPNLTIQTSDTAACIGDTVNLTNQVSKSGGTLTFHATQLDAQNDVNLINPQLNDIQFTNQTFWARVDTTISVNGMDKMCSAVASILVACNLDLALKKVINAPTPFFTSPGGNVPYTITVYNQFVIPADSIKVIDYLPSIGSSVTDPDWTNNGDGTACITLSRANGGLPASGLLEGDSVVLNFNVQLGLDIPTSGAINTAEIASAQDTFHNVLDDLDSDPNSVPNDETGTVDDEIDDDGTIDEDDSDFAGFFVLRDLVCNDNLNVSLGSNCEKCFTADDLLEGILVPDEFYTIQLYDATGKKLPTNCVDEKYIGYTLIYNVFYNIPRNQNSCWGQVTIEDKAPPLLNCTNDTVPCYVLPTLPLLAENADDCFTGKVELLSDEWFDYGCDSVLSGYVIRTIQGTDRWGNFRRCESIISIERTELDSVVCPSVVELPCEIRYQIGGVIIHALNLKTPIIVDQSKVTPQFLLELQKPIWDLIDPIDQTPSKGWVLNPAVQVVPQIEGQNIWPDAGGICKINSLYKDSRLDVCGTSFKIYREWTIVDWCTQEERTCGQYINVTDTEGPVTLTKLTDLVYNASAHDCVAPVTIPALVPGKDFRDCNLVDQTYILQYIDPGHPGKFVVLTGTLPSNKFNLPEGEFYVQITLTDKCQNRTTTNRLITVKDITPPRPVCDEFTQVTLDPLTCWARVAAKDLDNGSRDNCQTQLHFAAAPMSAILKARTDFATKMEKVCGKDEYWNNKAYYDQYIESWINCYVFSDSIDLDDCGTSQVVLRVYEADNIPVLDKHLWPCNPHAWFCYNTELAYRITHNVTFFSDTATNNCQYRPEWLCKAANETWLAANSYLASNLYQGILFDSDILALNGDAAYLGSNEYQLTDGISPQTGTAFFNTKLDLLRSFQFEFDIHAGTNDGGGDGMTFLLQNEGLNAIGDGGGSFGANGILNGLAIEFDTYYNDILSGESFYDHAAFFDTDENMLPSGINYPVDLVELEDGQYRRVRVNYDAALQQLCFTIDGQTDCVSNVLSYFGGAVSVYAGFTASNGDAVNLQKVRIISAEYNDSFDKLYSDCMINILVDDKQAPVVAELEDVLVYCDRAPDYASRPDCEDGDEYLVWPGLLQDSKGVEHGYYGGSDFLGIHQDEHETADACGYDNVHHWAPIYCRSWLYVDSFDAAGQIDPKQYFETLVLFDKTRPARTLLAKEFSITDNCRLNDTTLKVTDEGSLNGCGEGWIQRTWTIRDKCDNPITVRQKVVVKHRSDFEVIFPEDKVVECDFLNTTDPKDAGVPIISDDECEQVGVQYKDEIFTVEDSACYKIVRTWTLIDWCIYNPNADRHYSDVIVDDRLRADTGNRSCVYRHLKDNNDGYMKYIQVIKVIDKVAPIVTTRDTTICIYGEDCKSTLVRIPFSGTDNCTASSELSYRVEVDLNATESVFTNRTYVKTSIDLFTQSNPTEFVYSPAVAGKHVVHMIVKDNCGNEDTSSYRFELKDCKKPTPYCYNGIATVIMPSTGKITVWAKDLDAGSFDNCTLADKLKFSFSANSSESSKEFSCADIPDGKSKTIPVEIWVTDEAGNQDHCTTYILLQDNSGNACPDVAGLSVTIAGTIQTETKEPVEHVRVNIYGGAVQMNYQTGVKGTYHFEGLPSKSNYSLKSTRDDQPMNGISTLDLVLIQKHILGIELLDSPYKILAADIDNDKQITAIDLVELRKLILATYEDLPNNESWRFIPKSTVFADPQNPWNAGAVSEVLEMKDVATDYKSEDFIGLKVGDVNATAAPHSLMGIEVRGNETGLLFEITDQNFKRGDIVRVDFRSPNFRGISGWQGTLSATSSELRAASSLNLTELIPGKLNLSNQNLGLRHAQEGMITMSWNTNAKAGLDIDDQQVLFTLVFKAQENGRLSEVLRIGSQHTIAESYQGRGELGNLGIRFVQNGNEIVAKSALYQNYPNPFDQRTVIGINLASQGMGTLKVYDATGRTIKSVERDWTKGYHEVWFDRREIGATGVLYYRFESGFFNASKKMIIVD